MFKRKVYDEMLKWKNTKDHKPLLIQGLRQIGKSTIAIDFGKKNYKSAIFIDFRRNTSYHQIFSGDFDIDRITFSLSTKDKIKIIPNETLFIFDEIQDCPNARSSLKYFSLDGRYDVICTGSLLGIKNYQNSLKRGIPVGFEDYIDMKPMDFEEFLWANNVDEKIISLLKESVKTLRPIDSFIHNQMIEMFNKYLCIGGMPEVVNKYIETNDFNKVRAIQKRILKDYEADFGTHLNDKENIVVDNYAKGRILEVYKSIPKQLSRENQKFQYSQISKNAKSRDYKTSIEWLEDYGLISLCYNLSTLELPLEHFAINDVFKIYFNDTGLYLSLLDDDIPVGILQNSIGSGKGAIYENIAADSINKLNHKLYYYRKTSGLEIDFIQKYNNKVSLIEIKAKSGKTKSSSCIINNKEKYHVDQVIKFSSNNIGYSNNIYTFPYYLISFVLA